MFTLRYENEDIDVYEYADAEKLIMQLSDQYAGDVTAVARGGNGRNKIIYYNYPASFDIETTTIKPGELDYTGTDEDPPIAFPYLFQWCIYDKVIMVRHYKQAQQIFSWISQYFMLGGNRRLICFVHNLGYEWSFWRDLWDIDPEKSFALDEHHPVTIITKDGFMFRDSYKMTNMSLETLTKDWSRKYIKQKEIMDYSQLRTPYTPLDDNTLLYSALDVLSLSDAIVQFLKAQGEKIWTRCPTSTSFIRAKLKKEIGVGVKNRTNEQHQYWKILKNQKINKDMYEMLKRLARGGNTHANRAITGKLLTDLLHYDITSSYPAQMVCYPEYPLGEWMELDPGTDTDTIELFERNGLCTMFDLALVNARIKDDVPVPYIPIAKMGIIEGSGMRFSDNGRYLRGLKVIRISVFGIEWPIIKQQYDFDEAVVMRGYFARKGYLPDILRKFILEYYREKTELKGITSDEDPTAPIRYAISKAHVNGIFGMAFTDCIRQKYEFSDMDIIASEPPDLEEELERYQKSISYFLPYAWGAMVAALGRVYLSKMIDAAGNAFCYCDTDSTYALKSRELEDKMKKLEEELTARQRECGLQLVYNDIKGKPHELGGIDREPDCEYFMTYGSKKYATVEDGKLTLTLAGVPKKAGGWLLGDIHNFKLGFNFKGSETGKQCLWYNPDPHMVLHDEEGREIEIHSNAAMLPCDYLLSMGKDYLECLSVEGNFHWNFKDTNKTSIINEEDYI